MSLKWNWGVFAGLLCVSVLVGASCSESSQGEQSGGLVKTDVQVASGAQKIVDAAVWQIGKTVSYDPAYVGLQYPNGDIALEKGVCTDVVIRALRKGRGLDLQSLVHRDMKANFSKYPKRWGLKRPDKNIDHRRVPNLRVYFTRRGWSLPVTNKASDYLPGDLVTCTVGGNRPHIMVVSDYVGESGEPLIIHNIGGGTELDPHLFTFPITGHYRIGD